MTIPDGILSQHIAVLGKTRSGKSSVMRGLVESLLERQKPVCIIDPKGDWYGIKLAGDGKRPGYPVVIFGGEHADVPINEHTGANVAELFATGNRPCLIDLGGWMTGGRTRFWIEFASTLFKHTKGERWLVVDEIHNFAPKGKVFDVDAGKALHWANRLASEGLGKGLAMIFASQRPQKVHNDTLTSAETLIAMRVLHPSDRGAVSDWIKGCGDSEGSEVLSTLAQMDRGEGWVWSPEIGFGPKRVKFPMFKTYDSFRAQTVDDTKKLKGWAEVDLEEVKQKLASVIEKAKADDPRELRKQISDLRKELSNASTAKSEPAPDPAALEEAYQRGRRAGRQAIISELEPESELNRLAGVADSLQIGITQIRSRRQFLETQVESLPVTYPKHAERIYPPSPNKPAPQKREANDSPSGGVAQRILNSLAELEQLGASSPQRTLVAFLSGYTNLSSTGFAKALSSLSSNGLVEYPGTGVVELTEAGRKQASPPPRPRSAAEVQSRIIGLLGGVAARILEPIIQAYPRDIERQKVAEVAGYTNLASTGFAKALSRLSSLGFVEYPSTHKVRAAPALFLENR